MQYFVLLFLLLKLHLQVNITRGFSQLQLAQFAALSIPRTNLIEFDSVTFFPVMVE